MAERLLAVRNAADAVAEEGGRVEEVEEGKGGQNEVEREPASIAAADSADPFPPPRLSLMGLPTEILHYILTEHVAGFELPTLAFVCRAFYTSIRPRIWRVVEILYRVLDGFTILDVKSLHTIQTLQNDPTLRSFVRRIEFNLSQFSPEDDHVFNDDPDEPLHYDVEAWKMHLFPNAPAYIRDDIDDWNHEFLYGALASRALDMDAEITSYLSILPNVKEVALLQWEDIGPSAALYTSPLPNITTLNLTFLPHDLASLPSLQCLHIDLQQDEDLHPEPTTSSVVPPSLRKAIISPAGSQFHKELEPWLDWFLPAASAHLEVLELPFPSPILHRTGFTLPAVTSLRLSNGPYFYNHTSFPPDPPDLSLSTVFPILQTLILDFGPSPAQPSKGSMIRGLPPSLVSLTLRALSYPFSDVFAFAAADRSPALRRLTVDTNHLYFRDEPLGDTWVWPQILEITKRCKERGVELDMRGVR